MAGRPGVFKYSMRFLRFAIPHAWLAALAIVGMAAFAATNAGYLALVKPVISTLTEQGSRESAGKGVEMPEPPTSTQEALSGRKLQKRVKEHFKALPGAETLRTFVREHTDSLAELGLLAACLAPLLFISNYVQEYFRARLLWSVV
ncbi:MAG: hypothetical protein FJ278_06460, partial [Planctomycetes bacterium]|nr:hypothetical protein [Planctomycetota bacterium]